jgi:hypothetical protein
VSFHFIFQGTFAATLFVATISLMVSLIGDAVFGHIFRLMILGTVLGLGVSMIAGVNASLCSLLAAGGALPMSRQLKVLYNPNTSFLFCAIFMTAAAFCFITGCIFAIKKYDPYLEVAVVVITVIIWCCTILPMTAIFVIAFQLLKRG